MGRKDFGLLLLSAAFALAASYSVVLYKRMVCLERIEGAQREAISKRELLERELENLSLLVKKLSKSPGLKLSTEEKYKILMGIQDSLSHIPGIKKVSFEPVPVFDGIKPEYRLLLQFEKGNWSTVGDVVKRLLSMNYPLFSLSSVSVDENSILLSLVLYTGEPG